MLKRLIVSFGATAALLFTPGLRAAPEALIIEQLQQALHQSYPEQTASVQLRGIPTFVRETPCTRLQANFRTTLTAARPGGPVPVQVRCEAPRPWSAYVSAVIAIEQSVLIACHSLSRAKPLTEADLCSATRLSSNLRMHALVDTSEALGMSLKRPVTRGSVLYRSQLTASTLIKRGESIVISAHRGNARIAVRGIALQSGTLGEQIRVRNAQSGRKLAAWVLGPGRVSGTAPASAGQPGREISQISAKVL